MVLLFVILDQDVGDLLHLVLTCMLTHHILNRLYIFSQLVLAMILFVLHFI